MLKFNDPEFVIVGGRRLAYEEVCPPDPKGVIVLLAGLGAKRQGWYKQLAELGRYYRTLALDYRDVGDSSPADQPYNIVDLAEDTAGVLNNLEIQQAHLVGVSMGGFVALELALRHPAMVDKLVLVGTSAGGASRVSPSHQTMAIMTPVAGIEIGEAAKRVCAHVSAPGFAASHLEEFEDFAEIARYRPMSEATYYGQLKACRTHDVADQLHRITAPTLIIHGEVDPLVPLENGRNLAQKIPNAQLLIYPATGHIPEVERYQEFNRDVLAFLDH
jgi:pimeloyl-ACP methyl ester carboxylesterase